MAYVYRHIRLDKNVPFYIGIGLLNDNYARATRVSSRGNHWLNIYNKTEYRVEILFDGLTDSEAKAKEIEFISLYGRVDTGTGILVNKTDGGDGARGLRHSETTRKKLSEMQKGKVRSKEAIEKGRITAIANQRKASDETKDKIRNRLIGNKNGKFRVNSKEEIQALIDRNKNRVWSEDAKNKMAKLKTGTKFSNEVRLTMKKAQADRRLKEKLQKQQ